MAARIRTVYSKWRVGANDSVRLDDGRTISDRADRVVGPYKGTIDGITVIEREGQSPLPYEANADDVPIQAAGCGHPALRNGHR